MACEKLGWASFDVVEVGNLVAGEIGVVTAERDAGAARCVFPVGGIEQVGPVGFDGEGDLTHALVVRRARRRRRGHAPPLDGADQLVEFGDQAGVVSERAAVAQVVVGEVVAITAEGSADRGEGSERGAAQQPGSEQPGVRDGGWCVRSDRWGGEGGDVDAGVGQRARERGR